ncbi:hypothetical protein AVEN_241406-1 [Araneus ventricosus]|uniref:DUF7041 domain-containing protein n=1 Tax=Araneus ventricosus TaxID=182803 RepID=A0A4Y2M5S4_ARAVE|nr:hypothetical protein AVEN_241406-1 [Araneus ventricosus]
MNRTYLKHYIGGPGLPSRFFRMTTNPKANSSEPINEVVRISVKDPPFWRGNPAIWFSQLVSQFINSGISQEITKKHTVVGSIEFEVLAQVSDIIISPPADGAYETLKNPLFAVFSDSYERKFKTLLQNVELGDRFFCIA